jgi:hypothetical protein
MGLPDRYVIEQGGQPCGHASQLTLMDVAFIVSLPSYRTKFLNVHDRPQYRTKSGKGKRAVFAWAEGYLMAPGFTVPAALGSVPVAYNPDRSPWFHVRGCEASRVERATFVEFNTEGPKLRATARGEVRTA